LVLVYTPRTITFWSGNRSHTTDLLTGHLLLGVRFLLKRATHDCPLQEEIKEDNNWLRSCSSLCPRCVSMAMTQPPPGLSSSSIGPEPSYILSQLQNTSYCILTYSEQSSTSLALLFNPYRNCMRYIFYLSVYS
jgi:hypothetical protein